MAERCLQSVDEVGEVYDLSVVFTNQRSISLKWDTTRTIVKETHVILILDRGFFSMDVFLLDKASFVIPDKRNSKLYDEEIDVKDRFFYGE